MQLYCHLIPYEMIDKHRKTKELLAIFDDLHIKTKLQMQVLKRNGWQLQSPAILESMYYSITKTAALPIFVQSYMNLA